MNIFRDFFSIIFPIWNKYSILGLVIFVVGLILTPFIVGVPLVVFGLLLSSFGIYWGIFKIILKIIPGGELRFSNFKKYIINSYKQYFRKIKK